MNILISNDDGVHAKGINVLANAMRKLGRVEVIAPDRNRSGASNSLTIAVPVRVSRLENGFYSVTGTPTDCVNLAINSDIFSCKFDLVVAGINRGANLGDDVLYSGTVAAATEGRNLGVPAIAFSLVGSEDNLVHYDTAAAIALNLVRAIQSTPMASSTILNVNVPDLPLDEIKGYELTRLGKRYASKEAVETSDPRGNKLYWIGNIGDAADDSLGTDFYAVGSGCVSITPLQVDLTAYKTFDEISSWLKQAIL